MYSYLQQHPQIFMPFHKEPLFFGDDLQRRYGRMSTDEYLALFRDADPAQRAGEASAWYLFSHTAAREIHDFAPAADIIVMLRNPVDVMYAQHSQLLFNGQEEIPDFGEALAVEDDRRNGQRLPAGPLRAENLYYRLSVQFAGQLERYVDAFGRDRVHVIVYDDLRRDVAASYRAVLAFLGVDPNFTPVFERVNANKVVRYRSLQRIVYAAPGPLRRAAPRLRRSRAVHRVRAALIRLNSRNAPRSPMDPDLRRRLTEELAPEVERLGTLIGRDLSAWSDPRRVD